MNDWKLSGVGDISKTKINGTVVEFNYPCSSNYDCFYYYTILQPGYYKAEVWGAKGGGGSWSRSYTRSCAEYGGYSVGVFQPTSPIFVSVFVGGKGEDGARYRDTYGGFNGGGNASRDYLEGGSNNDIDLSGGGGGSSDIRLLLILL